MPLDGTSYRYNHPAEVAALLQRAKALIASCGWCQDTTHDRDGRYCIYGAMRAAGGWRNWRDLGLPWPAQWQDEPGRTVEEIHAWFDEQIGRIS